MVGYRPMGNPWIDLTVVMNQAMAHAGDQEPFHLGMGLLDIPRNLPCSLAHHLQAANYAIKGFLVADKLIRWRITEMAYYRDGVWLAQRRGSYR